MKFITFFSYMTITSVIFSTITARRSRIKRIVGGDEVNIRDAPYMISLEVRNAQVCGGAILTKDWVLTSAHCFGKVFDIKSAEVRVGTDEHLKNGQIHKPLIIIKYPTFNISDVDNDAALMQVFPPLNISDKVAPINLPDSGDKPQVGELLTVYGWGYTSEKGNSSGQLRKADVPVFPQEKCKDIYQKTLRVTSSMICLGYENGGKDACILDSGGPLIKNGTLYGLVSWGFGCARPNRPGVYTDLTTPHILEFIKQTIKYHFVLDS